MRVEVIRTNPINKSVVQSMTYLSIELNLTEIGTQQTESTDDGGYTLNFHPCVELLLSKKLTAFKALGTLDMTLKRWEEPTQN